MSTMSLAVIVHVVLDEPCMVETFVAAEHLWLRACEDVKTVVAQRRLCSEGQIQWRSFCAST